MAKPIAFLDANVLYPAPVRDLLLNLADLGSYQPKWSAEVQEEWLRNLLHVRKDLRGDRLRQSQIAMDTAFPGAMVVGFNGIINALQLPDPNDRHVLAAAIAGKASLLITENLRHFPIDVLAVHGIRPVTADQFFSQVFAHSFDDVVHAFQAQVAKLRRPPKTPIEVLTALRGCNLPVTVGLLEQGF